jgi:hypothetical protein
MTGAMEWLDQFEYVGQVASRSGGMPCLAVCFDCTPVEAGPVPMTYAGGAPRDEWAQAHASMAGHRVERYDVAADGSVERLSPITGEGRFLRSRV